MITVNEYIKKYKIKNSDLIEKRINSDMLGYSKIIDDEYYIDSEIYKIDFRRIPKNPTSISIKATIIQSINEFFHVDNKMLTINKSHFNEYLNMLSESKIIRLVKGKDETRVESYIIGEVIPDEILSNRTKLLRYVDKKLDLIIKTTIIAAVQTK